MILILEIAVGYFLGSLLRSGAAAILAVWSYNRNAGKREQVIAEYRRLLDKFAPEKGKDS